jgi:hypothetical protein
MEMLQRHFQWRSKPLFNNPDSKKNKRLCENAPTVAEMFEKVLEDSAGSSSGQTLAGAGIKPGSGFNPHFK